MNSARALIGRLFRGRGVIVADGVRFRERSPDPLHRSLGPRGPGFKEYDVEFPLAPAMRIRCTPERLYMDILGPELLSPYRAAEPLASPGMRILVLGCGTGYGADWLASRVGPSGAIVALTSDTESVRFAKRRYPRSNTAFELGGADSLSGEIEGSFDGAFVAASTQGGAPEGLDEVWRVLRPGGWLLATGVSPRPDSREADRTRLPADLARLLAALAPTPAMEPVESVGAALARRPPPPPTHPKPPDATGPPRSPDGMQRP